MQIVSDLENGVSLIFILSSVFIMLFIRTGIRRLLGPSETPPIHPENEETVNEIRMSRMAETSLPPSGDSAPPDNDSVPSSNGAEADNCPICLEVLKFAVETNCRHRFCGDCFYSYWQRFPPLNQPNCPVCRSQLRFLLRRFTSTELQMDPSPDRFDVESRVALFNRRFSGNSVSFIDQLRDLPTLLRYYWRVMSNEEAGISCLLRLRLIVLSLFVFFYVISPLDIFPELVVGVFGLLDDCLVCLVFLIYLSALFRGHLIGET